MLRRIASICLVGAGESFLTPFSRSIPAGIFGVASRGEKYQVNQRVYFHDERRPIRGQSPIALGPDSSDRPSVVELAFQESQETAAKETTSLSDEMHQRLQRGEGGIMYDVPDMNVSIAGKTEDFDPTPWAKALPEQFIAILLDKDDPKLFETVRVPNMIEHMMWVRCTTRKEGSKTRVLFDRTILVDDLSRTCGNLVHIAAESEKYARKLLKAEPYGLNALQKSKSFFQWRPLQVQGLDEDVEPYPWFMYCVDKPGALEIRKSTRPSHLDYLLKLKCITAAGPLLPPEGGNPVGSLVFFHADSEHKAMEIANGDPYNKAGLFDTVLVRRYADLDVDGLGVDNIPEHDVLRDRMEEEGLALPGDYPKAADNVPKGLTTEELMEDSSSNDNIDNESMK